MRSSDASSDLLMEVNHSSFYLDLLFRECSTLRNNLAISTIIDSTICPDVNISVGPRRIYADTVGFSTVVPIELHKKLAVRKDVSSPSSGLTWVDLAFRNVVLNIQNISESPLSLVGEMETHLWCRDIPKDEGGEEQCHHPAPEMPFWFICGQGHVSHLSRIKSTPKDADSFAEFLAVRTCVRPISLFFPDQKKRLHPVQHFERGAKFRKYWLMVSPCP